LPFDWGEAGWGIPAADLAQSVLPYPDFAANPDITTYWCVAREYWPRLHLKTVEHMANCGTLFRSLAALDWEAQNLSYDWTRPLNDMRFYYARMQSALRAMHRQA